MCLILIAYQAHPKYRLVVAANRDEFFRRKTASVDFWADAPHVLGGRDLEQGGTWMAVSRDGRWAAVTNFREGTPPAPGMRSRGRLVSDFLAGDSVPAQAYLSSVRRTANDYSGFNLLCADRHGMQYLSNRPAVGPAHPVPLTAGVHGLSNGALDMPWPKVVRGKTALQAALVNTADPEGLTEALLSALSDRRTAEDELLPSTGISRDWEKCLSATYINAPDYGTRASTVLVMEADGEVHLRERSFDERGELVEDRRFRFSAIQSSSQRRAG